MLSKIAIHQELLGTHFPRVVETTFSRLTGFCSFFHQSKLVDFTGQPLFHSLCYAGITSVGKKAMFTFPPAHLIPLSVNKSCCSDKIMRIISLIFEKMTD